MAARAPPFCLFLLSWLKIPDIIDRFAIQDAPRKLGIENKHQTQAKLWHINLCIKTK
jgi:hypothetical protein